MTSSRLGLTLHPLDPGDVRLLRAATLINVNWSGPRFDAHDVLTIREFAHYTKLSPKRGDFGLVASSAEGWAGCVWVVFLPPTDPGYGFVAPGVGELSLCVQSSFRRMGLGRELLGSALDVARRRGDTAVSLSVEDGNPAQRLYTSMGFVDVDPREKPGTMIRVL